MATETNLSRPTVYRPTVVDQLVELLRDRILDEPQFVDRPLPEDRVATDWNVGRPTARAAITALVADGTLTRDRNKPAHVTKLNADDVWQLFSVRRPLELEAVKIICKKRKDIPAAAVRACTELDQRQNGSISEIVRANISFHRALIETVEWPSLTRCFAALEPGIMLALSQSGVWRQAANAASEHRALLDAVAGHNWNTSGKGDRRAIAKREMLQHLNDSRRLIVGALSAAKP